VNDGGGNFVVELIVRCRAAAFVAFAALAACDPGKLNAIDLAPDTLALGLVAHYTFDEGGGSTVIDHSGHGHDGVLALTNGMWLAEGRFGGALRFLGNDFVTVSNFPPAASSFSVSAWIRSANTDPDAGYETVLSTEMVFDGGWQLNLVKTSAAIIQFAYWDRDAGDGGAYTSYDCNCLPENQWTHVVSVVDDTTHTLSVYVNGSLTKETPALHAIFPGIPSLLMGTWSGGMRFLVGDLDDVSIYSRALAPVEVAELYRRPPLDPN
jgi:hypothetical protein